MDQNSSGLCMLFGCAPEVWQDIMSEYHAFSERIGQEVTLRPLTSENLYTLVSDYLDRERMANGSSNTVRPFTEDSLELILQQSQGNVRQVLSVCSRMLDEAASEGRSEINTEFAEEMF